MCSCVYYVYICIFYVYEIERFRCFYCDHLITESDDDANKSEEKLGAHLAKYMPKEKILWKRLTTLIKVATETKLSFPKLKTDPNKTKQVHLISSHHIPYTHSHSLFLACSYIDSNQTLLFILIATNE
jgi:hypothetical protein